MKKIDNKVELCFLTADETGHGSHRETFEENQFIRKPIENESAVTIMKIIIYFTTELLLLNYKKANLTLLTIS